MWEKHFGKVSSIVACLFCLIALTQSGMVFANSSKPKDYCELYPITLPDSLVSSATIGQSFNQVPLGTGQGNYSWLTWNGSNDMPTLANSLVPIGNSDTYINPKNPADVLIEEGDWVEGLPGVKNSRAVRDNMDALLGTDIIIPTWSVKEGQGANTNFQVQRFIVIEPVAYRFNGKGWLTFVFKGFHNCYNTPPVAFDAQYTTPEDIAIDIFLQTEDVDGDPLSYTILTPVLNGVITGTAPNLVYTPNADFNGVDSFTFQVNDGEEASNIATVSITVSPVNDAPIADDQSVVTDEDVAVGIVLTGSDIEGDALSFAVVDGPANGELSGSAPNLTYTPDGDFTGNDSFTFKVNDGALDSELATVSIVVNPVNDAPVAQDLSVETSENVAIDIQLVGSDVDGDALGYATVATAQNGVVTVSGSVATYTPAQGFFGNDSFTYLVNDGQLDSNIATVSILVKEANKPPQIISNPGVSSAQGVEYIYDADAIDPNVGDIVTYSLLQSPFNAEIEADTGIIKWTPNAAQTGHNIADNPYCAVSQELNTNFNPVSDVTVVIDESGSMSGEHSWIAELIPLLDAHLRSNDIGDDPVATNLYGLVGFGDSSVVPRQVDVGGGQFGSAEEFIDARRSLRINGGTEDGWRGLQFALGYTMRAGSSRNMILVTDEDRDNTDSTITFESIKADLQAQNVILNVAVNARFECGDGSRALGLGQNSIGYVADGRGGFEICQAARFTSGFGTTNQDYIELALSLGGAAWDLDVLRDGGISAQSFSSAFVDIKVQEIKRQFESVPQADVVVADLSLVGDTASVVIKNRGLVDINSAIDVVIRDDLNQLTTLQVPSLLIGQTEALAYQLPSALAGQLSAEVRLTDSSITECVTGNNVLSANTFEVVATDQGGLSDSQIYALSVADANEAPSIVSVAETSASVDVFYSYDVDATDPDSGDAYAFELLEAPVGMSIDTLSGIIDFRANSSQAGQHTVTVKVTDIGGLSDTQTFTLLVDGSYLPPKFVSDPIRRAVQETQYVYQTQIQQDATATVEYRLFRGPDGLAIDSATGRVTWQVPANIFRNTFPVILQVQDQLGNYDIQAFELVGDKPPAAPSLALQALPLATENKSFSRTFSASDPNAVDKLTWELVFGPDNSEISADSGGFLWNPVATSYPGMGAFLNSYCVAPNGALESLQLDAKWVSWNSYIQQPLVGPLYDSNQDGLLNDSDQKVLVGVNSQGQIVALDALTGKEIWRRTDLTAHRFNVGTLINLDNDTDAEFVFVQGSSGLLVALNSDGTTRWISTAQVGDTDRNYYNSVQPVDLDNDGNYELLYGPSVFDADGQLLWNFPLPSETYTRAAYGNAIAVDLDGDGIKEVAYYNQVRDSQGSVIWEVPSSFNRTVRYSYFAYGNFDSDPAPEIVVNEYSNAGYWMRMLDSDGTQLWENRVSQSGMLNIADVDKDGDLEIFSASNDALYEASGDRVWFGGRTRAYAGSSLADIDADGHLDILRYDASGNLTIHKAATGELSLRTRVSIPSSAPQAAPIFVDVDGDNHGELVLGSSAAVSVFEGNKNDWLEASKTYSFLQQSVGEVDQKLRLVNSAPFTGVTSSIAAVERDSGRLSDLVLGYVRATPRADDFRIEVKVTNRGLKTVASGTVVELFKDSTQSSNKVGEIILPELISGQDVIQTTIFTSAGSLGDELVAKIKDRPETVECEVANNQVSSNTVNVSVTDTDNLTDTQYWTIGVIEQEETPTFVSAQITSAQVGVLYEYQVEAQDRNITDVVRYFLRRAPAGMSLDSVTGQIRWIPELSQTGRHFVQIQVFDLSGKNTTQSYSIDVAAGGANLPPTITSSANATASAGFSYRYDVQANDPEGELIRYALTTSPQGMSINSLTGVIQWQPLAADLGSVDVVVTATDESGNSSEQSYTLTVRTNAPPVFSSTPATSIVAGNTYIYAANALDSDGDAVVYSLITAPVGMTIASDTGLVQWATQDSDKGEHVVVIRASDIFGAFSQQTFSLFVTDVVSVNNPPSITSSPTGNAVFDAAYTYDVDATDTDGDTLTYLLTTAPANMSIDLVTGVIEWTPTSSQAGTHDVVVRVEDGRGGFATQSYAVFVSDGSTSNALPVISSQPGFNAKATFEYTYQIQASDADGDPLSYQLVESPTGMLVSATGLITWTPSAEQSVAVRVRVSDGQGYVEQGWTLNVLAASVALEAQLVVSPQFVDEGDIVTIQVTPINAVAPVNVSLTVDGNPVALDASYQAQVTATGIGAHTVEAIVADQFESVVESGSFAVRDPNDTTAPQASFDGLIDGQLITAPIDIVASVEDPSLAQWQLIYKERAAPADEFVVLADGTSNVTSQVLGTFDPSMLRNGQYAIILLATDSNGQTTQEGVTVQVDSDLKVGNFSITYEDLNVPLAGIPISVRRTYDSRDRSKDIDFGFGWSLDYNNIKVEESRTPGFGWEQFSTGGLIPNWCTEPSGAPVVTITLPDGDVESFEVAASPRCNTLFPINDVTLVFNAVGDTQSTLTATGGSAYYNNGHLLDDITSVGTENYANPDRYQLTTRAGYVYDLDQHLGIRSVTDPNGNVLTYSDDGIIHSDGKRVDFTRDALGRIVKITDPSGNFLEYNYTTSGDLAKVTERDGAETTFAYNSSHGLVDINDPLGRNIVKNIYDDAGRLIAQEDSEGNRTEFNHDVDGRQSIVTDRNGNVTQLFYDDDGYVTTQIDALGNTTTYTHDANGNETSQTNALGHQTQATFNARNDQLTQVDALGNVTAFEYNDRGKETRLTDARGNVFNNAYDSNNNLTSITDPLGNVASTTVNSQGLPSTVTDVLGNTTQFTYDSDGYKLSETDAEGNVMTFTRDANGNVLTETRTRLINGVATNETTTYEYDERDRAVKTIDALGNETQTEYNLVGNEVAQVDALGRRTELEYDTYNRLVKTTYPDGTTETKTYDPEGNMLTDTDRLGRTTGYEYDELNRTVKITQADGSITRTEYDAIGRVVAEVDANGNRTVHTFDAADRRIKTTDALGNETTFAYDVDGNMTSMTDANGNTTTYVYNALDQKVQTVFANASTMQDGLDALSRKTSMTDQAGVVTNYEYDRLGRLVKVIDALGQETVFTYDSQGNKLTQTDAEGRTTNWAYDALGRVVSRTLPLGQQETFAYDKVGNLIEHIDFNGQTTQHSYDVNNRLTQSLYAGGLIEAFVYDAVGNRTQAHKTENSVTTTTHYVYDTQNRLTSETQFVGTTNEVTLSYVYDVQGNRTQLTETKGALSRVTRYTFDALNRLATVTDSDGNTTNYQYDAVGNRSGMTHANGNKVSYVYDELNRLTTLNHLDSADAIIKGFAYTLHPTGRRTQIAENSGRTTTYTYDTLYRLKTEVISDSVNGDHNAEYTYDKVGNRTFEIVNSVSTAYTVDANDRLVQTGGNLYTHDANGNTTTQTVDGVVTTYSYNAKNELIGSSEMGNATAYLYNIDGVRIGKADSTNQTFYTVDSNRHYAQVLAEAVDGITTVNYTYGDDLISQKRGAQTSTYHYDGLGSTRALSDATGSFTDEYDYEVFGEVLNQTGTTENDYLFTGEQFDSTLDQYYLRARYYNQGVGRFTQMDTWMGRNFDPYTLHKYFYAYNDPANIIDPSGNIGIGVSFSFGGLGSLALRSVGFSFARTAISRTFVGAALQGGSLAIRKELRSCVKTRGKKCRILVPIVVVGNDYPNQREHIWDAQIGNGENFGGRRVASVLRFQKSSLNRKWPTANPSSPRGLPNSCNLGNDFTSATEKFGPLVACDEYPFSASREGGYKNYRSGRVSLRFIPTAENNAFGLRVLSRISRLKKGQRYIVAAFPWIAVSTVIDVKRGKR